MTDSPNPQESTDEARAARVLIFIFAAIIIFITIAVFTKLPKASNVSTETVSTQALPSYSAQEVISQINILRAAKGLPRLSDISSLDVAARARSDEMVANNIRDNKNGNPDIAGGYHASNWSLQSTWGAPDAKQAAGRLTSTANFALNTDFQDAGVGVSSYDDGKQLLVAMFLANPQVVRTGYQTYWYCWDTGSSAPHHVGYRVIGDHYCSYQELHDAGWPGY